MLSSSQRATINRKSPVLLFFLGLLSATAMGWSCLADTLVSTAAGGTEWNSGPTTAALGSVGELKVPAGYKFMDAAGARALLEGLKRPVPQNLLGILAQESEPWWAVLRFVEVGYVAHPEQEALNPETILKALAPASPSSNREPAPSGAGPASSLAWELVPTYDARAHTLQWAVLKQAAARPVVVQSLRLLCRRGAVEATLVMPYRGFTELAPLAKLLQGISLKAGERYEDYQAGDRLCSLKLAAFITVEEPAGKPALASGAEAGAGSAASTPQWTLWLGGGAAACALVCGGLWFRALVRRRKALRNWPPEQEAEAPRQPDAHTEPMSTPAVPPSAPVQHNDRPSAVAKPAAKPAANGPRPKSGALRKPLNGKGHGRHRRRVFDYERYFTDLMGAVSGPVVQVDTTPLNKAAPEPSEPASPAANEEAAPAEQPTVNRQTQLLLSQRELIAERNRLIQEQNKLLEEKNRLIAQKNELLRLQKQLTEGK